MGEKRRDPPFSLRLSFDERARLEAEAAGMPLASYIKWRVFEADSPPPRSRGKRPVEDHRSLAQALALLGQSRIANNLNQLARASNLGVLPVEPETEAALLEAAREVSEMRRLLIQALGLEDV